MNESTVLIPDGKRAGFQQMPHIPGRRSWPLLGVIPALMRDFYGFQQAHYDRYGPVAKLDMGFAQAIRVAGPDNFKQICIDSERNFSNRAGYAVTTGDWFSGGLLFRDYDNHRLHRRVFQSAFKYEAMKGYTDLMNPIVSRTLTQWQGTSPFLFVPHIKELLLNIAAKVFYGVDNIGDDAERISNAFRLIIEKGMMSVVKVNKPPFAYYYGMQGKKTVHDYIRALIPVRRSGDGKDLMSYVTKETRDDGRFFSDEDIIEHLAFLLFAAYDTTTSALSNLVMHLALDQGWQDRLRDECRSLHKPQIDFDDLAELKDLEYAFLETLRLYPSASMLMRKTIGECELSGYAIPANSILFLVPFLNHRMEQWWSDPWRFDPDRFAPGREEHRGHSFCYVPFGGGAHKCIGMNFAKMNAKLFMHQLLLKYRVKVAAGYKVKVQGIPLPKPQDNLPVIFEKL